MSWKTLTENQRERFAKRIRWQTLNRLDEGLTVYGQDFQGEDPIEEVKQELLDGLIYLHWVKEQRLAVLALLSDIVENEMAEPAAAEVARQAISIINGEDGP